MKGEYKILNKQAYRSFKSVKEGSEDNKPEIIECLKCFQFYLKDLYSQLVKRELKEKHLVNWVFKTQVDKKDLDTFCKANIAAASYSLLRIIERLETTEFDEVIQRLLLDFICDLKQFIIRYDEHQDFSWLIVNTNNHISNFYFELADNVFWHGKPGNRKEEKLVLATSTPFIIRQSIEYKPKRVLGIQYIIKEGRLDKTSTKTYFTAFKNCSKYYRLRNIDLDIIETIHTWSNFYVHSGLRAEPWRTETALHYILNLNYKGPTIDSSLLSIYASIEIDESKVEEAKHSIEESIIQELGNDIRIVWDPHPEVAVIKSKGHKED